LDHLIQSVILKNPGPAMVCSQLVYQIYEECGSDYHLKIESGLFQAVNDTDMADGYICLADLADTASDYDFAAFANDSAPVDEAELARELYHALTEPETSGVMETAAVDLGALPSWTKRFLEKLEEFLEKSESNIPLNALFVTPADLAYKTTNLTTVTKLDIKRVE